VAALKTVENFYDLSFPSEYKLIGKRSIKHRDEICETLAEMMDAKVNFALVIKRGADQEVL
jgi:hypothetical protein